MAGLDVQQFNNDATSTQAFLARDDTNKFLVLALRGSQQLEGMAIMIVPHPVAMTYFSSLKDFLIDAEIILDDFVSPGGPLCHTIYIQCDLDSRFLVTVTNGAKVHTGFLTA